MDSCFFPLEEPGARFRSRTDVADSPWQTFLAKAERKSAPGISRFLVGVVGKPGTRVLDIITSSLAAARAESIDFG